MFVRTTCTHVKFLLGKTSSKITFFVLFLVMLMTFVSNVLDFRGYDVIAMFHPMNILSLSYDRTAHNAGTALLLVQLLPLLVGWPASRPPSPCSSGSAFGCSCCFRCSFCSMPSLHSNPSS